MTEVLILIFCVVLSTLGLGLPLLVRADSLIPDLVGAGVLAVAILVFIWGTGAYWILLPILAIMALAAWLDRKGQEAPHAIRPADATGMSDRTRLRLRLWRNANRATMVLLAAIVISMAAGFDAIPAQLIVSWIVIMLAATAAFRFSFYRSCRRDEHALAGDVATE